MRGWEGAKLVAVAGFGLRDSRCEVRDIRYLSSSFAPRASAGRQVSAQPLAKKPASLIKKETLGIHISYYSLWERFLTAIDLV